MPNCLEAFSRIFPTGVYGFCWECLGGTMLGFASNPQLIKILFYLLFNPLSTTVVVRAAIPGTLHARPLTTGIGCSEWHPLLPFTKLTILYHIRTLYKHSFRG